MPENTGRMVGGRYRLDSTLGSGGMGTVWRAYDERLQRFVAVKEVRFPATVTPEDRVELTARALVEARSAAKLDHPNIVTVFDVVDDDERPWIVMRLIEGRSLAELVARDGPLDHGYAARVGVALLDAIAAAHAAGVMHRDVKPSNVLIRADGTPMLSDFSIAAAVGAGTMTRTGVLLGSPGYIAPERLRTGRSGPEADLFGLGATLYYAVEGRGPFDGADALAGLFAVALHPHPEPVRAGALAPVIDGLLEKDPAVRLTGAAARAQLAGLAWPGALTEPTGETLRVVAPVVPEPGQPTDPHGSTIVDDPVTMGDPGTPPPPRAPGIIDMHATMRNEGPGDPVPGTSEHNLGQPWRRRGMFIAAAAMVVLVLIGVTLAGSLLHHPKGTPTGGDPLAGSTGPATVSSGPGAAGGSQVSGSPSAAPSSHPATSPTPSPSRTTPKPKPKPPTHTLPANPKPRPTPTKPKPKPKPTPTPTPDPTCGCQSPTTTYAELTISKNGPEPFCGQPQQWKAVVTIDVSAKPAPIEFQLWDGSTAEFFYTGSATTHSKTYTTTLYFQVVVNSAYNMAILLRVDEPTYKDTGFAYLPMNCVG